MNSLNHFIQLTLKKIILETGMDENKSYVISHNYLMKHVVTIMLTSTTSSQTYLIVCNLGCDTGSQVLWRHLNFMKSEYPGKDMRICILKNPQMVLIIFPTPFGNY